MATRLVPLLSFDERERFAVLIRIKLLSSYGYRQSRKVIDFKSVPEYIVQYRF